MAAKNDSVTEVTNEEISGILNNSHKLVVVDFFAEWCMPCMMMSPIVDELSEKFKGKIKFGKVNVGDTQELANKYNISSIPNFLLFKNGKKVDSFVGSMSEEDFEEKLKNHL